MKIVAQSCALAIYSGNASTTYCLNQNFGREVSKEVQAQIALPLRSIVLLGIGLVSRSLVGPEGAETRCGAVILP